MSTPTPAEVEHALAVQRDVNQVIGMVSEDFFSDSTKIHAESSSRINAINAEFLTKIRKSFWIYFGIGAGLVIFAVASIFLAPKILSAYLCIAALFGIAIVFYKQAQKDRILDRQYRIAVEKETQRFRSEAEKLRKNHEIVVDVILATGLRRLTENEKITSEREVPPTANN